MHQNTVFPRSSPFAKNRVVSKAVRFSAGLADSLSLAHAAVINQTVFNPSTSTWNASLIWGNNAVTPENEYQTVAGNATNIGTSFTLNGQAWTYRGQIRDYPSGNNTQSHSTFEGGRLILGSDTRLLLKGRAGFTSTANILMEDSSHMILAPDGNGGNPAAATLAGTLAVADGAMTAIGLSSNTGDLTFTISSTITGGSGSTLQLSLGGNDVNRMFVSGDYSGFAGTFYLGTRDTGNVTGTGSTFSFAAGSAVLATLHITTHANFQFDLNNDIVFGSVILGADTVLEPGTYYHEDLVDLGFGPSFVNNGGSITVIPETSSAAFAILSPAVFLLRRRI